MFKNKIITLAAFLSLIIPVASFADDTEIYGVSGVSIEPNVMIIFDNSGSMTDKDISQEPYNPSITYEARPGEKKYDTNAVYEIRYPSGGSIGYYLYSSNVKNINSTKARADLEEKGYTDKDVGVWLPAYNNNLYTGNFLNHAEHRYKVAQKSIAKLLEKSEGKKYGLMHFTGNGGYVKFYCESGEEHKNEIYEYVNNMDNTYFHGSTPLTGTMAEAGLYFAGQQSWYNKKNNKYITYDSPIKYECQQNYIILVTDGEPMNDDDSNLFSKNYIINKKFGDYYVGPNGEDKEVNSQGKLVSTASLLNDVAYFLFKEDILPEMGEGTSYVKQNVRTHTIGFKTEGKANELLRLTAFCGDGRFFSANSSTELDDALEIIENSITETSSVFLAPAVPVNRSNRTSQSDWMYLSFFMPQNTGEWLGNIKKFAIGKNGDIYGSDGNGNIDYTKPAVDELGVIGKNACSFWETTCPDGNHVTKGGVGEILAKTNSDNRKIYYFTNKEKTDLTDPFNAFKKENKDSLGLTETVIENVRKFKESESLTWRLGAIIHSEPAIVHYSNTESVIYVGANDGMLHCFNDTNGEELWGFIPPGQKEKLETVFTNANHNYYVDGSPAIVYGDLKPGTQLFEPKYMIFGERRGGSSYYVLDIEDYNKPEWKYQIKSDFINGVSLGQSWSKPKICTISTETVEIAGKTIPKKEKLQEVFIIAGGYDFKNQDSQSPETVDKFGKAIYSVKIENGSAGKFKTYYNVNSPDIAEKEMKNCIVDINTTSTYRMPDGKEITTRIYAGDMGGRVFVFADDREIKEDKDKNDYVTSRVPDGGFPYRNLLFKAKSGNKIFYAPATSKLQNSYTEWVVFGTGNRENPLNTDETNKIYAVKNTWLKSELTDDDNGDLVDLTENLIIEGNDDQKKALKQQLEKKDGWSITFEDPGEKIISSPIISQGYVFFTTYVPTSDSVSNDDPCKSTGAVGISYLWAIELETGVPAFDLDGDGVKKKSERRIQVATMAQPRMFGDMISTPKTLKIPTKINFDYFFWRQR